MAWRLHGGLVGHTEFSTSQGYYRLVMVVISDVVVRKWCWVLAAVSEEAENWNVEVFVTCFKMWKTLWLASRSRGTSQKREYVHIYIYIYPSWSHSNDPNYLLEIEAWFIYRGGLCGGDVGHAGNGAGAWVTPPSWLADIAFEMLKTWVTTECFFCGCWFWGSTRRCFFWIPQLS